MADLVPLSRNDTICIKILTKYVTRYKMSIFVMDCIALSAKTLLHQWSDLNDY